MVKNTKKQVVLAFGSVIAIFLISMLAVVAVACDGGGGDTPLPDPRAAGDVMENDYNITFGSVTIATGSQSQSVVNVVGTPTSVVVELSADAAAPPLYVSHNVNFGIASIPAGGSVSVTHGLAGTPNAVTVTFMETVSGSAVTVVVPESTLSSTAFDIYAYKGGANVAAFTATGSCSWAAFSDDAVRVPVTAANSTTFTVQRPGDLTGAQTYY